MDCDEIALQLTLKAIENGALNFAKYNGTLDELKKYQEFNARQLHEFYNEVYKNVKMTNRKNS